MKVQEINKFVNNHFIIILLWILLLIMIVLVNIRDFFSKVREITQTEAINLINKRDAIVLDIRHCKEFEKGHIVNSFNLTLTDLKKGNLGSLRQIKSDELIIIACADGITSREFGRQLFKFGFKQIYSLERGINGWNTSNLPLVCNK